MFPRTARTRINKNKYLRPNQDPDLQLGNILTSVWVVMVSMIELMRFVYSGGPHQGQWSFQYHHEDNFMHVNRI